jgi:DNA-directed RNA polymerase specialized sigma24 family protein
MTRATLDHLKKANVRTGKAEEVELADGSTVLVRGLTRDEIVDAQDRFPDETAMRDNACIAAGLVDPVMTEEDVAGWAASAPAGDLTNVSEKIQEKSGLREGAGKSRISRARKRS